MVFNTIVFLMTVSHLRAVLSDPGIVPIPKTSMDFSDIHSESSKRKPVGISIIVFFMWVLLKKVLGLICPGRVIRGKVVLK